MDFKVRETNPEAATKETYTYKDYVNWPEEQRWELIDGVPYDLTPTPSRKHQDISRELLLQFALYLTGKKCRVYAAPFDVRLPKGDEIEEQIDTVVQPDLVVVCDKSKLDEKGCMGAPDLVIEIISPYTAEKDTRIKFNLYERVGVKEYWIVDQSNRVVHVYKLGPDLKYSKPEVYSSKDKVRVGIFEDLTIELKAVFFE